jgi:hypothetical protein
VSIDEFVRVKIGTGVSTPQFGVGTVSGRLVKQRGILRLIVDYGERHMVGSSLVPVAYSHPIEEVTIVRAAR